MLSRGEHKKNPLTSPLLEEGQKIYHLDSIFNTSILTSLFRRLNQVYMMEFILRSLIIWQLKPVLIWYFFPYIRISSTHTIASQQQESQSITLGNKQTPQSQMWQTCYTTVKINVIETRHYCPTKFITLSKSTISNLTRPLTSSGTSLLTSLVSRPQKGRTF